MSTKKSTYSQAEWLKAYRERFAERARGESGEILIEVLGLRQETNPMSTEPKRGTCGWTGKIDVNYNTSVHQTPHLKYHSCIDWREGESAPAQPCPNCDGHGCIEGKFCDCSIGQLLASQEKHVAVAYNHETGKKEVFVDRKHQAVPPAAETAPKCEHCNDTGWLPETELLVAEPCDCRAETAHTRNSEALADFVSYCEAHPDQRFWQALRNWSEYPYVLVSGDKRTTTLDTFHWEGRRHDK